MKAMRTRKRIIIPLFVHVIIFGVFLLSVIAIDDAAPLTNAIVKENLLPGSKDWWHRQSNEEEEGPKGFTTKFSVQPNDQVDFKVDFSPQQQASGYNIWIFRLGYYGGLGGRLVGNISVPLEKAIRKQPKCAFETSSRMTDCDNWDVRATWKVPGDAISGLYVGIPVLSIDQTKRGYYIPFVVRSIDNDNGPSTKHDILFKTSDLTWVAYNQFGGWNVYRGNGSFTFASRAFKASYNRPFQNRLAKPRGQHQNFFLGSEVAMIYWLEKHGFDVAYASCGDVESWERRLSHNTVSYPTLKRYKVLFSVGHDEYWTPGMRRAFEWAREEGIHLAFFSGNEIFWRVLWQDDNISSRIAIIRKETIDGITTSRLSSDSASLGSNWTGTFVDPRYRKADPPNALTGQLFKVNGYRHDAMSISAHDSKMRFWRDTIISRLSKQSFPYQTAAGILGYEWDVFSDDCHRPSGIMTLSTTTVKNVDGYLLENYGASYKGNGSATHKLTLYRHKSNSNNNISSGDISSSSSSSSISSSSNYGHSNTSSLVFGSGTVQWSWGLSDLHDADQPVPLDINIQQATINLLADMGVQPASLQPYDADMSALAIVNGSRILPTSATTTNTSVFLVRAMKSTDVTPPLSSIVYPRRGTVSVHKASTQFITIRGFAVDRGGGNVANVEVSVDGGLTWRMSSHSHQHQSHNTMDEGLGGTIHHEWVYRHKVVPSPKGFEAYIYLQKHCNHSDDSLGSTSRKSVEYLINEPLSRLKAGNGTPSTQTLPTSWVTIMSRAVDDSGNVEILNSDINNNTNSNNNNNTTVFYMNREFINTISVQFKYSTGARFGHSHKQQS